jgi:hypothetical protein
VDKGYRKHSGGHSATIPLCIWHHCGILREGFSLKEMEYFYGPSLARSKKRFIEAFGTERDLLEITNEKLGVIK